MCLVAFSCNFVEGICLVALTSSDVDGLLFVFLLSLVMMQRECVLLLEKDSTYLGMMGIYNARNLPCVFMKRT